MRKVVYVERQKRVDEICRRLKNENDVLGVRQNDSRINGTVKAH
jgi:hypothetical protein